MKSRWQLEAERRWDLHGGIAGPMWPDGFWPPNTELTLSYWKPINETLPPPPPQRTLPDGFSLCPDRQRPPRTKGERVVEEIRSKLGLR